MKGAFFTIGTVAFLMIFLFIFVIHTYERYEAEMSRIEPRILATNDFIKSLERDAERGLYISSYRALLALESQIINTGKFLNSTNETFHEALFNGTVYGENSSFMIDSTIVNWIDRIKYEANNVNLNSNISINNVELYQDDPWYVKISANLSLLITDKSGLASWERNPLITTIISIEQFEDPIYVVNSLGRTTNIINKTPYENNYVVGQSVSNFIEHAEESLYSSNDDAPSFLQRFENDSSANEYGIESFVNLKELEALGLTLNTESSVIDHFYWKDSINGLYKVNNTPSWISLDSDHLDKYQVTNISYLD